MKKRNLNVPIFFLTIFILLGCTQKTNDIDLEAEKAKVIAAGERYVQALRFNFPVFFGSIAKSFDYFLLNDCFLNDLRYIFRLYTKVKYLLRIDL